MVGTIGMNPKGYFGNYSHHQINRPGPWVKHKLLDKGLVIRLMEKTLHYPSWDYAGTPLQNTLNQNPNLWTVPNRAMP